jgi:hypothetical protein
MPKKATKTRVKPSAPRAKVVTNSNQTRLGNALNSRWSAMLVVAMFIVLGIGSLMWAQAATATTSLWTNDKIPKVISDSDIKAVELGVKFKAMYAGKVTGVKFYKGPQNTGKHVGTLWTADGRKLASVTFQNESNLGWQTALFATPVDVVANTTYVVSYHAPNGRYSANNDYFTRAYANADGLLKAGKGAGVYAYGAQGTFPKSQYRNSNYWVDVVFSTSRFFPETKPVAPTNLQATSLNGGVNLTWTASPSAGVKSYVVTRDGAPLATIAGVATGYKDMAVTVGTTYNYKVHALDENNVASDATPTVSVKVAAAPPQPTPTPTPNPTPTPTPTPAPQPTSGFPGPTNTGYKNAPGFNTAENPNGAGKLATFNGTVQSNTTYKFVDFPNGLYIGSASNHPTNVTFIGCRFASNATADANVAVYGDSITFSYSSFEPRGTYASATTVAYNQGYQYGIDMRYAGKLTVDHSDFWGWGNGIQFGSSTQDKPVVVKDSWFHHSRNDGGIDHTDAILENYGGQSYMVFDHNTIAAEGNTNGLALQDGNKRGYSNVKVTNNYFSGFAYTINIGGDADRNKNVEFTGNTYGTDIKPMWGPLYGWSDGNGNLWRNNKWRVAPGGYSTKTTDDGKYWWPDGTLSTSDYAR